MFWRSHTTGQRVSSSNRKGENRPPLRSPPQLHHARTSAPHRSPPPLHHAARPSALLLSPGVGVPQQRGRRSDLLHHTRPIAPPISSTTLAPSARRAAPSPSPFQPAMLVRSWLQPWNNSCATPRVTPPCAHPDPLGGLIPLFLLVRKPIPILFVVF
jgi:hypothetical protein